MVSSLPAMLYINPGYAKVLDISKRNSSCSIPVHETSAYSCSFSPSSPDAGLVPNPSSVVPVPGLAKGLPLLAASADPCFSPSHLSCHLLGAAWRPGEDGDLSGVPLLDRFFSSKGGVCGVDSLGVEGERPPCDGYVQFLVS